MTAERRSTTSAAAPSPAPPASTLGPSEAATNPRDFVITRQVRAPRAVVFAAWTEPARLARWWGPEGFTTPVCEADVRPGGAWRIVMRGPDGVEYPIKGVYREVVAPERLVFTDNWEEHPAEWQEQLRRSAGGDIGREALNTVTFEERDGGTLITIRTRFESAAVRDAMVQTGMQDGWSQSLDRLEAALATG
jgi:uncharacterized protein YndB with AHSA1/START domain